MFHVIVSKYHAYHVLNVRNEWVPTEKDPMVLFFRTDEAAEIYATKTARMSVLDFYIVAIDPSRLT